MLVFSVMEMSLNNFFYPKNIAVVGASNNPKKFGYELMKNIVEGGYRGKIFPINIKEEEVMGFKAAKTIKEVQEKIDLVIIAIPAGFVPQVVRECAEKGIKNIIIVSGGFSEVGEEGKKLEEEVVKIAKENDIRIIGPNCVGIQNTEVSLNASFVMRALPGSIGIITQSGALGASQIYMATSEGIGFSKFINLGNACDVSIPEAVKYLADDPQTKVIALYIEGVSRGKEFMEALKYATAKKPVVVVKAGRTEAGMRAVLSHTGSLAGKDAIFDAVFKQTGAIRVETLKQLFNVSRLIVEQPPPSGKRIAIITNAGGAGVLSADECAKHDLILTELTEETKNALRSFLPPIASVLNPVDIIASANMEVYRKTVETVIKDPNVDCLLVACVVPTFLGMKPDEHARGVVEALKNVKVRKTVIACWMAGKIAEPGKKILSENHVPAYSCPKEAVYALAKYIKYLEFKKASKNVR